jgi:putative ABC transport system ATP-binding protein
MRIATVDVMRTYSLGSRRITAVNKANLEVQDRKFTAIIGPSGSGKTTLLNLVGLNDYPTSGRVFVDGADASLMSHEERRKTRLLRMGFVFQTFNLLPTLSSLENVELPMALAGKPETEQKERAMMLLQAVGLSSRFSNRPIELSTGEVQRVAIARALANNPETMIADEPTGELDSKTADEIIALLLDIKQKNEKTVIVATHDEKIVDVADNVYAMQNGDLRLQH